MKPFDLKAALDGAPVVTRDGRKVGQLCSFKEVKDFPLVGVIEGWGAVSTWTRDGEYDPSVYGANDRNLFMAPTKREGWVILYRREGESTICATSVFNTKEAADAMRLNDDCYVSTTRIEWEE